MGQICDPVSTMLEDHKISLLRTNETLRAQRQQEKDALAELVKIRERLREDLRDKTEALQIDLNCLSHEALKWDHGGHQSLTRNKIRTALAIDKTFSPTRYDKDRADVVLMGGPFEDAICVAVAILAC